MKITGNEGERERLGMTYNQDAWPNSNWGPCSSQSVPLTPLARIPLNSYSFFSFPHCILYHNNSFLCSLILSDITPWGQDLRERSLLLLRAKSLDGQLEWIRRLGKIKIPLVMVHHICNEHSLFSCSYSPAVMWRRTHPTQNTPANTNSVSVNHILLNCILNNQK